LGTDALLGVVIGFGSQKILDQLVEKWRVVSCHIRNY